MLNNMFNELLMSLAGIIAWGIILILLLLALAFWPVSLCLIVLSAFAMVVDKN